MDPREEIREALKMMPVSWLHIPALAHSIPIPLAKDGASQPKPLPIAAWAALGVVTGGGLAYAGLNSKNAPADAPACPSTCNLTLQEIEDQAVRVYEAGLNAKDGGSLDRIVEAIPQAGAKILPAIALGTVANASAVAYLTGTVLGAGAVVAGAAARRRREEE